MSDGIGEALRRHPEKRVLVGHKRRSSRMTRCAMEELAYALTFARSHRRDIDESLDLRVPAARSRNNRTAIRVAHQHHRPAYPLKGSSQGFDVVGKRGQWNLHRHNWHAMALEGRDDLVQLEASAHAACTSTTVGIPRL